MEWTVEGWVVRDEDEERIKLQDGDEEFLSLECRTLVVYSLRREGKCATV